MSITMNSALKRDLITATWTWYPCIFRLCAVSIASTRSVSTGDITGSPVRPVTPFPVNGQFTVLRLGPGSVTLAHAVVARYIARETVTRKTLDMLTALVVLAYDGNRGVFNHNGVAGVCWRLTVAVRYFMLQHLHDFFSLCMTSLRYWGNHLCISLVFGNLYK